MYALGVSDIATHEPRIVVAKDPVVTELLDCCVSIMGDDFIRLFTEGHSNLKENCLYCASKNGEIIDIYFRTEEKEDLAKCIRQISETLLLMSWDEERNRYQVESLLNLSCLSRVIAAKGGTSEQYLRYGSTIRSLLDKIGEKREGLRKLEEKDWDFIKRAREVFMREEEM